MHKHKNIKVGEQNSVKNQTYNSMTKKDTQTNNGLINAIMFQSITHKRKLFNVAYFTHF